jgi:hypothetical protein
MAKGRLTVHGGPHSYNQIRRRDAEELRDRGEPIPLSEAARILQRSTAYVRSLIDSGQLHFVENSTRPVFRAEVEQYAQDYPRRWLPGLIGTDGRVSTIVAAKILGLSRQRTRELAQAEQLPALRDDKGRWWFRVDQVERAKRARDAMATRHESSRPNPTEGIGRLAPPDSC